MRKYNGIQSAGRLSSRGTHHFVLMVNTGSVLEKMSDDLDVSLRCGLLKSCVAALEIEL